jgi:glycolate oxidase FAD binding subunit
MVDAVSSGDRAGRAMVAQWSGSGLLRLEAPDLARWRSMIATSYGGSLVVLRSPPELKSRIDAWGDAGDALPLMRRVKEQFDPTGVLNPGRFVGGI